MTRAVRRSWAILAGALMLAACTRKKVAPAAEPGPLPPDTAPILGSVTVQPLGAEVDHPERLHLDVAALTTEVRTRLQAAGLFAPPLPDGGAGQAAVARVRIEFNLEEATVAKRAAARTATRLRIDTRPSEVAAPHWGEDVQAGSETQYDLSPQADRNAIFQKLVSRTIADLLAAYVSRQKVWRQEPSALSRTAGTDAGDLRIEAIRAMGERRMTSEVPTLLRLLADEDESVRDAALGALVELRDRRAIRELGKLRSMRDKREMRKILDAIGFLGGEEAADYLTFVAQTHDEEEIRQMAKQALERLQRRTGTQPAPNK